MPSAAAGFCAQQAIHTQTHDTWLSNLGQNFAFSFSPAEKREQNLAFRFSLEENRQTASASAGAAVSYLPFGDVGQAL